MPLTHNSTNHNALCFEVELKINNLDKLAEHVGLLLLGKHRHVAAILASKNKVAPASTNVTIDKAISQLTIESLEERYRRDGWIFQLITWISMRIEQPGVNIISQMPHDNAAQHGIDGLGIILTPDDDIGALIIVEDKYTENPRSTIKNQVWPEFALFENGEFDSQLVARTTGLLSHLDDEQIDKIIANDLYKTDNRIYRVGITPLAKNASQKKRKKLFKDFDKCILGDNHLRRQALTFSQFNIREWMDAFSLKISSFLETQRP